MYKNKAVLAQLSGSGSAIYGFFESLQDAETAKSTLKHYQTYLCPLPKNKHKIK
jgi:4-diphosphocytidyl-2C-methyl-D-erythritol kinase